MFMPVDNPGYNAGHNAAGQTVTSSDSQTKNLYQEDEK
jgi:hypothetical protein